MTAVPSGPQTPATPRSSFPSGGDDSRHVVPELDKPDARGELGLKAKPCCGKFECFIQLVPQKVSRRLAKRGVTPPRTARL